MKAFDVLYHIGTARRNCGFDASTNNRVADVQQMVSAMLVSSFSS
jgi:hypothetical protein